MGKNFQKSRNSMLSLQKKVDLNSISFISAYRLLLLVALLSGIYGNCVFDLSVDRETDPNCQLLGCFGKTGVMYRIDGPQLHSSLKISMTTFKHDVNH